MIRSKMIFTAEKESFIVRVLMKKVKDAGVNCIFVPCDVNSISAEMEDSALIVSVMDDGSRPGKDVLHYLKDAMEEKDIRMIPVGDQ